VIRLLAATTASIALSACSSETVPPQAPPIDWHAFDVHQAAVASPTRPTPSERGDAEAYAAAIASPGFALLRARLDGEVHLAFPGMSDARGRDAVVHAHEVLFGAFDGRTFAPNRVWRTESTETLSWTLTGVQARDWMGVAATQKPVTFAGLTLLWTKDDGTITDVHVYFDVAVVKAQLGAGPKELASLPPPTPSSAPPQIFEADGSPDQDTSVALARTWLDALEKNDERAYLGAVTDDVEIHTLERPQALHGKDEARSYFRSVHKAIGQLDTTVANAWSVSRFAVVEYFLAGEQLGPLGWIPAQRDKVVRLEIADVIELRDGKIARVDRYDNPGEIRWSAP
jgi:ketosteroid isomerase-like protein